MKFFKNLKKGAVFGLDARIALAVLAVVSLSIGLAEEKKSDKQKYAEMEQYMEVLQAKFLKHYEKVIFDGYYTTPTDFSSSILTGTATDLPGYGKEDKIKVIRHPLNNIVYTLFYDDVADTYSHTYGIVYDDEFTSFPYALKLFSDYHYFSDGSADISLYAKIKIADLIRKMSFTYDGLFKEEGRGIFANRRNPLNRDLGMTYVIEMNVDQYAPADYILHVVMYSPGKNKEYETTIPGVGFAGSNYDLDDIYNFPGAQGDDIVHIFSTKDIYLKAKAENNRRLDEIKEKIMLMAENRYLDRISLCATETVVSASCDLDTDGDYDVDDKNLLLDYNAFPKSSLDTSSADYYDGTTAFDYSSDTGAETFLSSTLGLPEYYAYDLYGNVLTYQSNVGLKTKGPYTMEVWY